MSTWLEKRLEQVVHHPPRRSYSDCDGRRIEEEQTLTGHVTAARDRRRELEDYGIDMDLAQFDEERGRWEGCLFSAQVADMLQQLTDEGQFPYPFEALPSVAELDWLKRRTAGAEIRALHPLRAYRTPAPAEKLAKLAEATSAQERSGMILPFTGTPAKPGGKKEP